MEIRTMTVGDRVEGFYLLRNALSKQAASGKPFLSVELADATGAMEGKV